VAQRRHHYEHAFEEYLRARRIPYVAVDEARKSLLPDPALLRGERGPALKSFDFVIYGQGSNLLVEVKGRQIAPRKGGAPGRLESWVTLDDVTSLERWEGLFGPEFQAAFVFVYWCESQPPDALFQEVFEQRGRWYALRAVRVRDYKPAMKVRSPKWGTVHVPGEVFEKISSPFALDWISQSALSDLGRPVSLHDVARETGFELPALEALVR
jgi:hypothetical protein